MRDENNGRRSVSNIYERDGVSFVPYTEINGIRTVLDEDVRKVFDTMESDETLQIVFCDGSVSDRDYFLKFMKVENNLVSFIFYKNKIVGFAWINGISKNYCYSHFCLFKSVWGKKTDTIGRMLIDYWMGFKDESGDGLFDILIGMIPSFNTSAINFIKKLGYVVIGEVPMIARRQSTKGPMTISYYRR